jgi:hypothetical protein
VPSISYTKHDLYNSSTEVDRGTRPPIAFLKSGNYGWRLSPGVAGNAGKVICSGYEIG